MFHTKRVGEFWVEGDERRASLRRVNGDVFRVFEASGFESERYDAFAAAVDQAKQLSRDGTALRLQLAR